MEYKNITEEQLELLGVYSIESRLYPNRHFVPHVGEVNLYESISISDILKMIYQKGIDQGEILGKEEKIREIKKVFDID